MNEFSAVLRQDEKAVLSLRGIYEKYGYKRYKMSKFEAYDLYLENKSFLASEKIVTFSNSKGKLLALKPDITLSIIKNAPRNIEGAYKVYYCENVYRAGGASDELDIKEIMQVGIEHIGDIDLYGEGEVLTLAARSLKSISENSVIGISHMGLISRVMENSGLDVEGARAAGKALSSRNLFALREICGADSFICKLAEIYGRLDEAIPQLKAVCKCPCCKEVIAELEGLCEVLSAMGSLDAFVLDFSVSNDMNYYNGITFQGFIDGIPRHVLSGGRYDALAEKMGHAKGAIGFAVYPDILERFHNGKKNTDVDVLVSYGAEAKLSQVAELVEKLQGQGNKVCAVKKGANCLPTYREILEID